MTVTTPPDLIADAETTEARFLRLWRFDPHGIAFGPPLVTSAEPIDELAAVLDRSLGEVLAEDETAR